MTWGTSGLSALAALGRGRSSGRARPAIRNDRAGRVNPAVRVRHVRCGVCAKHASSQGVLGTLVSRPHSHFRGLRPRAGGTPAFPGSRASAAWAEIRQPASRTDPKPWNNAVPAGQKISRIPFLTFYINNLRTAHMPRLDPP